MDARYDAGMNESQVGAGWHADPSGVHQLRYWSGEAWTEHVSDEGVQTIAPLRSPEEVSADAERAVRIAAREQGRQVKQEAKDAARAEKAESRALMKAQQDVVRAERAEERARVKADEREHAANNPAAMFGSAIVAGGMLTYEFKKHDMTEATAEATLGSPSRRSTVTRMGAGVLIAGPVGLLVGAVARKDTSKCYVTIETPNGVIVVEGRSKDYPAAVKFADAVNRSRR